MSFAVFPAHWELFGHDVGKSRSVDRCVVWLQVPAEAAAVVAQLQRVQPRMMSDTIAMAEALEGLTVTRWEAWAGLLMELSLETNRKLLSLRVRWQLTAWRCSCWHCVD